MPRPLDRGRQRALMPGARAKLASGFDLASLGNVAAQARGVLVVDLADLVDAEATDFAPSTEAATTATTRSTSTAARATSATWATWAAPPAGTVAARTIAAEWTVALCAGPEPGARRFTVWTAPTWAIDPLSWSVVAHCVLSFSDATVFRQRSSGLERRLAVVPGDFLNRSGSTLFVRPGWRSARGSAGTSGRTITATPKTTIAIRS